MDTATRRPEAGTEQGAARWRADFPALHQRVNGRALAYLDNSATLHKPRCVIDAVARFYEQDNANVHRGVHALSQRATAAYEEARARVQRFLGARAPGEVVFVRGTTEAINLVAQAWLEPRLAPGDEVLVTEMEHHSNIVPWQQACRRRGAVLRAAPFDDDGALRLDALEALLGPRTRLLAITQVSNALGSINDVARAAALARARGIPVLVDGAQAVAHLPVDVQALGCDFYAFSGHKCCGPLGIGVLYGRRERLEEMAPWQAGGDMVRSVSFERTEFLDPPQRFEAGTPDIAGAIGLGVALEYLVAQDYARIGAHEQALLERASTALGALPGLRIVGTAPHKAAIVSFTVAGVHPHDVGTVLDDAGIAVRTGHHCAMPALQRLGAPAGTVRASFAFYNTFEEAERLAEGVREAIRLFR